MGSGIAQVSAQSGYQVTLVDLNEQLLGKAVQSIQTSLERVAKKQLKDRPEEAKQLVSKTMANLATSQSAADAAKSADLVVEAVVENLELKRSLYRQLDSTAPAGCLFASNTSSLGIAELAEAVPNRKPTFGGCTSSTLSRSCAWWRWFEPGHHGGRLQPAAGVQPQPGQVGRALQGHPRLHREPPAGALPHRGRPHAGTRRRHCRGHRHGHAAGRRPPMGPIELADYVGLDTTKFIMDGWHAKFPNVELFKPSDMLNKLVEEGRLGRKTGRDSTSGTPRAASCDGGLATLGIWGLAVGLIAD
uniref:3HCDH_N domain-containing protein n=1 Tax=Macrostomum lignano TaxID=282301 RepID=A0A1I8F2D6_9PLAT